MFLNIVRIDFFCRMDVYLDWLSLALNLPSGLYWMKNNLLCKILLKLNM